MNVRFFAFGIIASAVLLVQSASAITANTLAQFLGVSSWETTVSLPPGSFTAEIFEIVDGKLGASLLQNLDRDDWAARPETAVTIAIGPHDGCYKVMITLEGGTTSAAPPHIPLFDRSLTSGIPKIIGEGDLIFSGTPKDPYMGPNDVRTYARGFLLRVKKKAALSPAEDAKVLRCSSNAKQIAVACELYAMDNNGKFPTKREEILPDYIADPSIFICPWWTLDKMGYELLGGNESDAPAKPLVRARYKASDGKGSVVYIHGRRVRE